jgi:hypothetical protein
MGAASHIPESAKYMMCLYPLAFPACPYACMTSRTSRASSCCCSAVPPRGRHPPVLCVFCCLQEYAPLFVFHISCLIVLFSMYSTPYWETGACLSPPLQTISLSSGLLLQSSQPPSMPRSMSVPHYPGSLLHSTASFALHRKSIIG